MNFSELSQVVRYLRKTLPCSGCQATYEGESIEVLSTFDDQGLFNLHCPHCHNQILVHITISDEERNLSEPKSKGKQIIRAHRAITEKEIDKQLLEGANISTDDIINMHFFLNQFNGDFKQLFSKQK
jgi:hypothetical protein